jgi:imidazoleglycerol phosphate dehydratase HisB
MNEQIQKLAELAGFNLHNDLIDGHNFHHEIEKFAQLIARECADLADLYKNPNSTSENEITLSNAIKNKFGIYE